MIKFNDLITYMTASNTQFVLLICSLDRNSAKRVALAVRDTALFPLLSDKQSKRGPNKNMTSVRSAIYAKK